MKSETITLFHRRKDGRVKVWMAKLSGDRVSQSWGEHGGKIQSTTHVVKGNDRSSPMQRAAHRFERLIEMRERKGYVRTLTKVVDNVMVQDDDMSFDRLPRNFAPAKPRKKISLDEAMRWDKQGLLYKQRKRDGMRHRIVSDGRGHIRIFSSSNEDVTTELTPLVAGLRLPPRVILDVELTATDKKVNADSFKYVSTVARSRGDRAHRAIKAAESAGVSVRFVAFDLLYDHGKPTYRLAYELRYGVLTKILEHGYDNTDPTKYPYVTVMPLEFRPLAEVIERCKRLGWEGLVVWRKDQATVVRMNGSPERCNCWKIKFVKEEDVIATNYELGKGRNSKVVGKLRIAVRGKQGLTSYVPMGKCGTGLDDKTREEALGWRYPCVVQIEYDSRSEKGFRFPVFIRKRDDKRPQEVGK